MLRGVFNGSWYCSFVEGICLLTNQKESRGVTPGSWSLSEPFGVQGAYPGWLG